MNSHFVFELVHHLIDDAADRDAEDIIQDVILNLFKRTDFTVPIEDLSAYVYRSLRNRAVDHYRKKRHLLSLDRPDSPMSSIRLADVLEDTRYDTVTEVEKKDIRKRLYRAIDSLDEKDQAVVVATELQGRTFRALSKELGIPIGTLLARKSRALQKIRRQLEDSI